MWVAERSQNPFLIINMCFVLVSNSGPQRVDCVKGTSQHISHLNCAELQGVMKELFSRCGIILIKSDENSSNSKRLHRGVGGFMDIHFMEKSSVNFR